MDPNSFGRIPAQTAKQIMIQKIREAERDVIFSDYEAKIDTLVNGTVQRFDKGAIVVNLGRTEGIIPRQEQVFNEQYRPGDRIRAYVVKVQKKGQKVMIILSRTHPNLVKELFTVEVPEIGDRIVEIKGIVREPGHRTKIAVHSSDMKVDAIGACVGVRGTRIRNIVEELNGEKIDIVRWNESPGSLHPQRPFARGNFRGGTGPRDAARAGDRARRPALAGHRQKRARTCA